MTQARHGVFSLVAIVCAILVAQSASAQSGGSHWVGTWAAALGPRAPLPPTPVAGQPALAPTLNFNNHTLRQIVRVSIGGPQVRIVFSNAFGTAPLIFDFEATVPDPAHPTRILEKYSAADHLHPNDAGYAAIGASIDLKMLMRSARAGGATR